LLAELRKPLASDWPGTWSDEPDIAADLRRVAPGRIDLDVVPAEDALDELRARYRTNIRISDDLAGSGDRDEGRQVTLHGTDLTLKDALLSVGRQAWPQAGELKIITDVDAEHGVVLTIANDPDLVARAYDVRQLLPADDAEADEGRQLLAVRLRDEIDPDSWRDNGGSKGWISWIRRRVVVITQTYENHRRVREWMNTRVAEGTVFKPAGAERASTEPQRGEP
jgi:hypothetical protein